MDSVGPKDIDLDSKMYCYNDFKEDGNNISMAEGVMISI